MKVNILDKQRVFDGFFKIDQVKLEHEKFDGHMSDPVIRLCFERGDAVAALVHDTGKNRFLLVNQFRYPTYNKDTGWIVELPAGMVGNGEFPKNAVLREISEECGEDVVVSSIEHISTFYVSPGGTSERIHLFYAQVRNTEWGLSGNTDEDEYIQKSFINSDYKAVIDFLSGEHAQDAKTIIAMQWWMNQVW